MIKVGGDYNDTGMDQIFKADWRGVFFFNAGTAELVKQAFLAGRWTQYVEFLGLNGNTVDQAGRFNARQKELAFFAQDQWYVSLVPDGHARASGTSASTTPTNRFST